MKKFILIPIIILFISCGYHKDEQVYTPFMSNESYYRVRVFPPQGLTNSGAIMVYDIPMYGINDKKVDSINKVADKFILDCIKYTKN